MARPSDRRLPNQWQESAPGWRFDGWGVARGGRSWEPDPPLRPGGTERLLLYAGWAVFVILVVGSATMDDAGLGLAAIAVAVVNLVARRIIRRVRARNQRDGGVG